MAEDLNEAWQTAVAAVDAESEMLASALRSSRPLASIAGTILIATPNAFMKRELETNLSTELTTAISDVLGKRVQLAFTVSQPEDAPAADPDFVPATTNRDAELTLRRNPAVRAGIDELGAALAAEEALEMPQPDAQLPPPSGIPNLTVVPGGGSDSPDAEKIREARLNPRYSFDTFVIGQSNRFASAAAQAVAESPGHTYNPLFIYGGSGLGKTHLMHAIGTYALTMYPHLKVKYVSSEEFTNDFINAIRDDRNDDFQRRYRNIDILMIDDIQFMQNKEETMEAFFHTFNALYNANKQVVITSDQPPRKLEGFEDRMRSRFEMGVLTDVQPPDLETRIAILRKKAIVDGTDAPPEVFEYIASLISNNIRELEGALIRVTAMANLSGKKVDLQMAQTVLRDIITAPEDEEITPSLIKNQTAAYFGTTVEMLCSSDRTRSLVVARQIAMYLCRELTQMSLVSIGKEFGDRDHTTVIHAEKKIRNLMSEKEKVFHQVADLTNQIKRQSRNQN